MWEYPDTILEEHITHYGTRLFELKSNKIVMKKTRKKAISGHILGDSVEVATPSGKIIYKIVEIK